MYESRAYDDHNGDPVVVLVTRGTHDVSRLVALLQGRLALCEHIGVADTILRQVKWHNGGGQALKLLAMHGGPDFTGADADPPTEWIDPEAGTRYDLTHSWVDKGDDEWRLSGWRTDLAGRTVPLMSVLGASHRDRALTHMEMRRVIDSYGPLTAADSLVQAPSVGA